MHLFLAESAHYLAANAVKTRSLRLQTKKACFCRTMASTAHIFIPPNGTMDIRQSATQMNYPLRDDLEQSVKAGCASLLVFRQDLERTDFQQQVMDFYKHCGH